MAKYKKDNVIIEAFKFYVDNIPDWFMDKVTTNEITLHNCNYKRYSIDEAYCEIKTPEGTKIARGGEYIVKDNDNKIYPVKPSMFCYKRLSNGSC